MLRRLAVCVAIGLAGTGLAVPLPAQAEVCNLIADTRGDAAMVPGHPDPPGLGSARLDIVSGDVASNARALTVAIRVANLKALDASGDSQLYDFYFSTRAHTFDLSAVLAPGKNPAYAAFVGPRSFSPNGDPNYATYGGNEFGRASGRIRRDSGEIDITIRLKDLHVAEAKFKGPLTKLEIRTWRQTNTPVTQGGYREDLATGSKQFSDRYTLGTPSCLSVGSS